MILSAFTNAGEGPLTHPLRRLPARAHDVLPAGAELPPVALLRAFPC
jgi:hypothetical protein